jgi:S-DNA-T family DNA segregation ATPase FtsK/SpoIIIE
MISLPTVFEKRLTEAMPEKTAWIEAWGFFMLGLGLFLAMACYTFNPYDYTATGMNPRGVTNFAGPYGAWCAAQVLGRFGVVGMIWPVAIFAWGILTATGFVFLPRPRRILGLMIVACDLAGFAAVLLPLTSLPEPSFGFGGITGNMLRASLLTNMGLGGSVVALSMMLAIGLVLTRNFTVSKTADFVQDGAYVTKKVVAKAAKRGWRKYVLNKDTITNEGTIAKSLKVPATKDEDEVTVVAKRKAVKVVDDDAGESVSAKVATEPGISLDLYYDGPTTVRPESNLFSRTKKAPATKDFKAISDNLTEQLAQFKIMGEIQNVTQGPVVTTYEFKPAPGTKVSKISALGEDLARLLKAQSLRVLAPIPGKDTVGFEVPNSERAMIGFADLIECKEFKSTKRRLPIAMGVDIFGNPVVEDLAEMPHLLVAGSTGSGKSVFMNTLIGSLIARHSPKDLRLIMIDPKMVEMAAYNGLPHMACPVITDPQNEAKQILAQLTVEMDDRYQRMRAVGARNIESFNEVVRTKRKGEFKTFEGKWLAMPYVVLIIDEMADMMMLLGKDCETPITRLAQKARACGIHLVIATQRPSAEVVTGLIKANFPTRVAFRVMSGLDSRTILDQNGAETLLGKGDMLYCSAGGVNRMHGAFLSEGEVQSMVKTAKSKKK